MLARSIYGALYSRMVKICGICRLLALNGWEKIDWRFSVTVCLIPSELVAVVFGVSKLSTKAWWEKV